MPIPEKLRIPLQPKQLEAYRLFTDSPYTRIGIGGSRGGAKSHALRAILLLRRFDFPGTRGMIFRKKFNDLWENHIQKYFEQFPWTREVYNVQNKEMTFEVKGKKSVLAFRYAEHESDIDDFLGKEYMDIGLDEATQLSERALIKFEGCNRWPGIPDAMCKILHTMNPGGPGHAYMKRVYITQQYKPEEEGTLFKFVAARAWDNVEWATTELKKRNMTVAEYYALTDKERFEFFIYHTQYGKQLNALPEGLRIGWLLGNWEKFAGQYFTNFFEERATKSVNEVRELLKPWHPRWISMDWGFAHPSAIHWHAQIEGNKTVTYRELYDREVGEREWGRRIIEASGDEKISRFYLSPDAFEKRTSTNTISEEIGDVVIKAKIPRPERADNDRVGGWRLMYELLDANLWIISQGCTRLIDSIPMLIRQQMDKNPEDVEKLDAGETLDELGDDAPDCLAAGTLVTTIRGDIPIEKIEIGTPVLTRQGWKRVTDKWLAHKMTPIVEARFSNGARILATDRHRFFVNGGFIPLSQCRYGDTMLLCNHPSRLNIKGGFTAVIPRVPTDSIAFTTVASKADRDISTATCGKMCTAQFQEATLFITKTRIPSTTKFQTSFALPLGNMLRCTTIRDRSFGVSVLNAATLTRFAKGNPDASALTLVSQNGEGARSSTLLRSLASSAERLRRKTNTTACKPATFNAVQFCGLSMAGCADVYELSVEDAHEFFANGILVSNSARYGLKSHLNPRKKPQEIVDREEAQLIADPYVKHFFLAKRQAERENRGEIFEPTIVAPWEKGFE